MANTVKMKRSATPSKVPTTSDLDLGEVAINTYDGKMYIKKDNGTASIVQIGAGGTSSGNVVGPSSSTNNALVRFDGTTGELIQNSGVIVDDNNNINANSFFSGYSNVTASGTQIVLTIASVPVYTVTGSGGQTFKLPDATTLPNGAIFSFNNNQSSGAIIVNNNSNTLIVSVPSGGYVTVVLLSNASAAGSWDRHDQAPSNVSWSTNTFDYAGSITSATWNGVVVAPNRGGTGQSTYANGELLIGNSTGNTLSKATLTAGTGVNITNAAGSISISNAGIISATAIPPLHINGTTTPEFYIDQSTSTTNGYLSSTDWNTFNNKGSGSVTSVALSVPTGLSVSGSPITSSGTLNISYASGYSLPSNATQTTWTTAYNERQQWDGGSTGLVASTGRTSLGATTLGNNLFTITNPSAITFPRFNADNTVTALTDSLFRTAISAAASGTNTDITSIALTSGTITTAPTSNNDIVNKAYADSLSAGLNFHSACNYATTAALSANTYNNGTSGVGATLTANANGALTVDGSTPTVGQRILIKNESTQSKNGIYTVTQVGSGSLPYILTRATDFDTSGTGVNEIAAGDFVLVLSGTANSNTSWVQQTPAPITVGTTAIVFTQFGGTQAYTAGTGLTLSTYQFSITNVGTAGTYGSASSVPVITTNAQGQVTSVTNTSIAIAGSAVSGNIAGNAANVTGTVALANGGTGQTSAPAANAALNGFTTTATASGTTTLTNSSSHYQLFTGTLAQTIVLPVTSTLTQGWQFQIVNNSTGNLTIQSSGANAICTVLPQTTVMVTCILTSGTTAASWEYGFGDYSETAVVQFGSFGVGTAASGTAGEIRATNNVTAYYTSDKKFKENIRAIPSALPTVCKIGGKLFDWTDEYIAEHGGEDGYFVRKQDFGVIAQDVQEVFDVAVRTKKDGTLAVDYEKMCALAFAAIKELNQRIVELEQKVK